MLRFSGAGVSDVGLVRAHNEDSAFVAPYVCLVADGVGGAAAGEVASATTAHAVAATVLGRTGRSPEQLLRDALTTARESLRAGVELAPDRAGMATTLTAVVSDGQRVVLGHLGDSRAYLLRHGRLEMVSTDHTYVHAMLTAGRMTPAEARRHPWRNIVLRSVDGTPSTRDDDPDLVTLDARAGDRLLLCSDGLTDGVPEGRIAEVLRMRTPQSAAAVLVQAALSAGGRDNVTCVVADVVDGPVVSGDGRLLGALTDIANVVDPAAVRTTSA
jgi:protein phosphatase